jgi:hypothetical protein
MMSNVRDSDRFLYAVLVWCLFSFKLVLIGVGESGIRADDLLILVTGVILLLRGDLHRIRRSAALNIYLGFLGVGLISALWNSVAGRVSLLISLFFVARLLQYLVFYYMGYIIARRGLTLSRVFTIYLVLLGVTVPLQMLGLFPVFGTFAGITSRAVGNTNGPYELAMVASFMICYLGYYQRRRISSWFSFLLILLSASRITSVAAALSATKVMLARTRSRRVRIVAVAVIACLGIGGFLAIRGVGNDTSRRDQKGLLARLSTASSGTSLETIGVAYDHAPVYQNSADYYEGEFVTAIMEARAGEADMSGLERLFRWTTLIKSTLSGADSIFLGLGPSFGTAAVDGYFVRVFIETGLLGVFMFGWFAWTLLFRDRSVFWPFREYFLIMLATGCFIDIFVSYKPMLLLWLWYGMHQYRYQLDLRSLHLPNADTSLAR